MNISGDQQYAAFISYAHADERVARRLHEALESYDLPDGVLVNGRESFSPIFRDVTELTAAHSLSEKIRQALEQSSFLIVLCSPASKDSHWVNEEIRLFRELHGDRAILSAIVDGTPTISFPPALLENGHEPLAANLKQGRDSFRFGVHQLAASILGVGLDTLVQRGERKRRLKTQLIMAGMTALAVIMSGFAFTTFKAQKAAEKSRDDAERLVEYMVSDLKSELYSLQRLDILDGLGEEIITYYEGIDPERLSDDRLVKLIVAIQTLAEVSNLERNFEKSERYLADASRLIDVLEKRDPDSDNSLFYRAQNEFWEGQIYLFQNDSLGSLPFYRNYLRLGHELYKRDPSNKKWIMEAGWGENNIAIIYKRLRKFDVARRHFQDAIKIFEKAYNLNRDDNYVAYEFANIVAGLADLEKKAGNTPESIRLRRWELEIYNLSERNNFQDYKAKYYKYVSEYNLLKMEGHLPCTSKQLEDVTRKMSELTSYEPDNILWRNDFLFQKMEKLEDCKYNHPEKDISKGLKSFFTEVEKVENKNYLERHSKRIKKLRGKAPEP